MKPMITMLILLFITTSLINSAYAASPDSIRPYHDFFRKLIQKKKRVVRRKTQRKVIKQPQKKVIPKLVMLNKVEKSMKQCNWFPQRWESTARAGSDRFRQGATVRTSGLSAGYHFGSKAVLNKRCFVYN